MAVFTTFKQESLARHLVMYDLGELHQYEPIEGGIENSNYFVTLDNNGQLEEFVLTIAEGVSFDEIPFFNQLMSHLFHYGLPVPEPQRTLDGMTNTSFCRKPTSLFPRLPGAHPVNLTINQCRTIGVKLAELHDAAQSNRQTRPNPYSSYWVNQTLDQVQHQLSKEDFVLLQQIAAHYAEFEQTPELSRGIIHGDLFRDNALFVDEELTGIIDFFHACEDFLMQDIAITINDWCAKTDGSFDDARQTALLDGYQTIRHLTDFELESLSTFQRFAALRFTLTRLISGEDGSPLKDPEEFLRIVRLLSP